MMSISQAPGKVSVTSLPLTASRLSQGGRLRLALAKELREHICPSMLIYSSQSTHCPLADWNGKGRTPTTIGPRMPLTAMASLPSGWGACETGRC